MTNRPLLSFDIYQMESYAKDHWYSLEGMKALRGELQVRRKTVFPRVRQLSGKVSRRVAQLQRLRELLTDSLEDETFCEWFFEVGENGELPTEAIIHGFSPVEERELVQILSQNGVEYAGAYSGDVETLIIGKEGWNPDDVRRQLDFRTGKSIRVYSREMILAFLACGKDPLCGEDSLLEFFSNDHPGLSFLKGIGFPWPSTTAFPGLCDIPEPDWPQVGLLSHMGYRVGRSGEPTSRRREILAKVFEYDPLPNVDSADYMKQWGSARSGARLRKLAETIASLARNEKRRNSISYLEAIRDREEDLAWLKQRYYTGQFRFQWPSTSL